MEEGDIDSGRYGFAFGDEASRAEADAAYQYWPEPAPENRYGSDDGSKPKKEAERGVSDQPFRVGVRRVVRGNSIGPSLELQAADRYHIYRSLYGPLPYVRWAPLTDTTNALYEQEVTGNSTLPKTKDERNCRMRELRSRLQMLYWGGLAPGNAMNVYQCEDDEERVTHVRMVMESTPMSPNDGVSTLGGQREDGQYRSGGREGLGSKLADPDSPEMAKPEAPRARDPIIGNTRTLNAQESLNALVDRTLVGETAQLLLRSLAPATQAAYLRGWKFWSRYCDSRGSSPWIDTSYPQWGRDLLNYLTWARTVMKVGVSALATLFVL